MSDNQAGFPRQTSIIIIMPIGADSPENGSGITQAFWWEATAKSLSTPTGSTTDGSTG